MGGMNLLPIQRQAIPALLKGRELFAIAPTGMFTCVLHLPSSNQHLFTAFKLVLTSPSPVNDCVPASASLC